MMMVQARYLDVQWGVSKLSIFRGHYQPLELSGGVPTWSEPLLVCGQEVVLLDEHQQAFCDYCSPKFMDRVHESYRPVVFQ